MDHSPQQSCNRLNEKKNMIQKLQIEVKDNELFSCVFRYGLYPK